MSEIFQEGRTDALSLDLKVGISLNQRVREAAQEIQKYLLSLQNSQGYWCAELKADATLPSDYILMMHFLGVKDLEKVRKLTNSIRAHQLEDGGWNIYPGGPSEISATVKAYTAFKLAGFSKDEPFMEKAREAIIQLGGVERCNSFTKIYLALMGQYDWNATPAIPPEIILAPKWFYFNVYEISSWSRAIVIPLSITYAFRPVRPVPKGKGIDELFQSPRPGKIHFERKPILGWKNFFLAVDRLLKVYEKSPFKPLRKRAIRKAAAWMLDRLEMSDGLGAIYPAMVNSVFALSALGYAHDHPLVARALKQLQDLEVVEGDTIRLQPCFSPVWDTGLALVSLTESEIDPEHPALKKSARWLLEKEVRHPGDWKVRTPHAEPAGWYFEFQNEFYPDVDDTLMILIALKRLYPHTKPGKSDDIVSGSGSTGNRLESSDKVQAGLGVGVNDRGGSWPRDLIIGMESAMQRGLAWVRAMRNRDGGWASFDRDNTRMIFTKVPFADHNAMLDPSTSDITGRALECLSAFGFDQRDSQARSAIEFLKREQERDGSWYGRWGVNYIYGTWQVLKGLSCIGEDMTQEYIQRAVHWLQSFQNPDGGWGETCRSYDEPCQKAKGPSTPSQTAWALMGLFAARDISSSSVQKGLQYLLDTQKEDGSWDEEPFTGTGFPGVFYIKYEYYKIYFPLFALSYYMKLKSKMAE